MSKYMICEFHKGGDFVRVLTLHNTMDDALDSFKCHMVDGVISPDDKEYHIMESSGILCPTYSVVLDYEEKGRRGYSVEDVWQKKGKKEGKQYLGRARNRKTKKYITKAFSDVHEAEQWAHYTYMKVNR